MARGCARIDSRLDTAKIGSDGRVQIHRARLLTVFGDEKRFHTAWTYIGLQSIGCCNTGVNVKNRRNSFDADCADRCGVSGVMLGLTEGPSMRHGPRSTVSSIGVIGFVDGFSVGASALDVRFVSAISGGFAGNATGQAIFSLEDLSTNQFVFSDQRLFVYSLSSSSSRTTDVTLAAGHSFLFNWSMEADASAGIDQFGPWGPSTADLAHTGTLNIDVLTPNEHLSFLSGANYSSITDAVPEPSTSAMMLLGFAGIGFMACRRKSKPALMAA